MLLDNPDAFSVHLPVTVFLHFLLPNFKASSGMAPFSNAFDHAADISFKFPAFLKFFFFNLWREILGNFFESGGAFQSGRVD